MYRPRTRISRRARDASGDVIQALDSNEFVLYYQPLVRMSDKTLYGYEALIRWNHPLKGIISPDEFMPRVEGSKVMIPLGNWIIEEATRQLREWRDMCPGLSLKVSINLSPRQFVDRTLVSNILRIVEDRRLDPEDIIFEITESAFFCNMKAANDSLLQLKSEKFHLYLDDFGTGYSSLAYLLHFPMDCLKIDRSFVEWMHLDEQSQVIVHSVIGLAHNLGMRVTAEGICEPDHVSALREMGCDFGQGFLIGKPLAPEEAAKYFLDPSWSAGLP